MSRVTKETVEHVARLAHLSLTETEQEIFARQLDEILSYAESIQELDTAEVDPMSHTGAAGALREGVLHAGLAREVALAGAPDASDGLFRVPRII